jgi:hypothetical protein
MILPGNADERLRHCTLAICQRRPIARRPARCGASAAGNDAVGKCLFPWCARVYTTGSALPVGRPPTARPAHRPPRLSATLRLKPRKRGTIPWPAGGPVATRRAHTQAAPPAPGEPAMPQESESREPTATPSESVPHPPPRPNRDSGPGEKHWQLGGYCGQSAL